MYLAPTYGPGDRYIDVSPRFPAEAIDPGLTPMVAPNYSVQTNRLYKDGDQYFIVYTFRIPYARGLTHNMPGRGYTWNGQTGAWERRFTYHAPDGWLSDCFVSTRATGWVHYNPESNEIFATASGDRHGPRLTGPIAATLIAHARQTIFKG